MNAIYSLLIISFVAGIITSTTSFFLHRASWHTKIKKNPFSLLNIFVTNVYQFNGKFLGTVSLSVSIATSIILGNSLYIIFYCDSLTFAFEDVAKIFLAIIALQSAIMFILYSFFYEQNLIEE